MLQDFEGSPLPEREKALLRFVARVNHHASEITVEDMEALRACGWTDEALYLAVTICALFNFYNRWVDACGVQVMSEEAHREFGTRTARHGYIPK